MKSASKSLLWLVILGYSVVYWVLAYRFARDTGPVFKGYMGVFGIFYILSLICFEVVTNRKKYAGRAKGAGRYTDTLGKGDSKTTPPRE